jgi:hypothetical protein
MNATALLEELSKLGVIVTTSGRLLELDAPRGVITAELREDLRQHKFEIISLLQSESDVAHSNEYIELLYVFEERAAIMEFDGDLSREEATRNAAREVFDTPEKLRLYAGQHPAVRRLQSLRLGCEIVDVRFSDEADPERG